MREEPSLPSTKTRTVSSCQNQADPGYASSENRRSLSRTHPGLRPPLPKGDVCLTVAGYDGPLLGGVPAGRGGFCLLGGVPAGRGGFCLLGGVPAGRGGFCLLGGVPAGRGGFCLLGGVPAGRGGFCLLGGVPAGRGGFCLLGGVPAGRGGFCLLGGVPAGRGGFCLEGMIKFMIDYDFPKRDGVELSMSERSAAGSWYR